jgi:hypothetical protein
MTGIKVGRVRGHYEHFVASTLQVLCDFQRQHFGAGTMLWEEFVGCEKYFFHGRSSQTIAVRLYN